MPTIDPGALAISMSPRPGRIVADVPTPFSCAAGNSRAVKASADFIAAHETSLEHIWQPA